MTRFQNVANEPKPFTETFVGEAEEHEPKWLDTRQCAARLSINEITLIRWRKMNPPRGPRAYFARDSRVVRYKTVEVDLWMEGVPL